MFSLLPCPLSRVLEEVYEDLGDTLAIQYGGSQLVHRIQTYRKVAPVATHGRDLYQTIHRYYRNAFTGQNKEYTVLCNLNPLSQEFQMYYTNVGRYQKKRRKKMKPNHNNQSILYIPLTTSKELVEGRKVN